jgi:hypothetical protein
MPCAVYTVLPPSFPSLPLPSPLVCLLLRKMGMRADVLHYRHEGKEKRKKRLFKNKKKKIIKKISKPA